MSWFIPTSQAMGLVAQNKLLKYYIRGNFQIKNAHALNYIVVKGNARDREPGVVQPWKRKEKVLVLMHGFGLGLGFFYENFDTLSTHYDRIIAVDWPGMGCSSRETQFTSASILDTARATLCSRDPAREREIAQAVTDEMIDSLERLRIEEDIPHFTLAGHSLGGYLAGKYAVKYPNAVENLILISPVGIPHPPPAEQQLKPAEMDWRVRAIDQLWRWNVTPQGMLRVMGPRGPKMVTTVVNRRFGNRWAGEELDLIADYMYHISAAPGSGEYTLNALLEPVFLKSEEELAAIEDQSEDVVVNAAGELSAPAANRPTPAARKSRVINARSGVFARLPLEDELCKLKVPILLLYGDNDWLYYAGAENSVKKWKDSGVPAAALGIVSNAGHHLYLDNSKEFNRALISWATNTAKITSSS